MKKLLFILFLSATFMVAYAQTPVYKAVALNGLDEASFSAEQGYFAQNKDRDNRPDIVSVWFSAKTIAEMVTMLDSEKDQHNNKKVDGIRIYFVADATPPLLKASIVLVSTTYSPDPSRTSNHRDYFDHNINDPYFTDDVYAIKGKVSNDGCNGGAKLYDKSGEPDPPCIKDDPSYVPRSDAENMVIRFRDKKHVINTISVWYKIELFEEFVKSGKFDGIRIYFARKTGFLGIFTGRNTFLITTTKTGSDGKTQNDYFDCDGLMFLKKYKKTKDNFTPAQDNGELCPYNCN